MKKVVAKQAAPPTRAGQVSVEKKLDALIVEFRHVMYGNGEVGVLEAVRNLQTAFKVHEDNPIHGPSAAQTLANLKQMADHYVEQYNAKQAINRNRRRRVMRAVMDVGVVGAKWLTVGVGGFIISYVAAHWHFGP